MKDLKWHGVTTSFSKIRTDKLTRCSIMLVQNHFGSVFYLDMIINFIIQNTDKLLYLLVITVPVDVAHVKFIKHFFSIYFKNKTCL